MGSEVCGRFCIRFFYGNCRQGQNCEFCHLTHREPKVKMDKVGQVVADAVNAASCHRFFYSTVVSLKKGTAATDWNAGRGRGESGKSRESPQGLPAGKWFWVHGAPFISSWFSMVFQSLSQSGLAEVVDACTKDQLVKSDIAACAIVSSWNKNLRLDPWMLFWNHSDTWVCLKIGYIPNEIPI